jgi:hypothetical protein
MESTHRKNPFESVIKTLQVNGKEYKYVSLRDLNDKRLGKLN